MYKSNINTIAYTTNKNTHIIKMLRKLGYYLKTSIEISSWELNLNRQSSASIYIVFCVKNWFMLVNH